MAIRSFRFVGNGGIYMFENIPAVRLKKIYIAGLSAI